MSRTVRALLLVVAMLVAAAVICAGALFVISGGQPVDFIQTAIIRARLAGRQDDLNRAVSSDNSPVRFTVSPGDNPRAIAARLYADNLIIDPDLFVDYVRVSDLDVELEAGTYFPNRAMTIPQIALMLTDSRASHIPFRILEGHRMEEIAASIDEADEYFSFSGEDFLRVVGPGAPHDPALAAVVGLPQGASLEGLLYPDTYQLPPEVTPEMLRDILVQQFLSQVGSDLRAEAEAEGMTLHEAVTLASIIEREGVHEDEYPRIASVYRNRLRRGQALEADPTVQYPLAQPGNWWPQITQADYRTADSPYNTYLNTGLPPGPIANPGIAAIEAAIHPEDTPYFYFRARCDGSGYHVFAETYEEHLANAC